MITDLPGSTTTGVNFDIIVQEFERKVEDSLGSCVQQTSGLSKGHPSEGIVDADSWMDMDRYGYVRVGTSHCRLSGLTIPMFVHLSVCVSACLYAASPAGKCKQAGKASRGKAKKKQAKE